MKKSINLSLIPIVLLIFFTWSCQMDNFNEIKNQQKPASDLKITRITKDFSSAARLDGEELCGDVVANPMYGLFQHANLGYVYMGNDEENLYVNFETDNGWKLYSTYLFVGAANNLPVGFWGMPRVGNFPYIDNKLDKDINDHTMTVPLSEIDECTTVAAFAIIYKWEEFRGHKYLRFEGVWAHGTSQIGRTWGWGWTNDYCVQNCEGNGGGNNPCSEAWADATNSYEISSNQLGWYSTYNTGFSTIIKTLYVTDGISNISNGTPIGSVSIFYYDRFDGSYDLSVTYQVTDASYQLSEVHLYVGDSAPTTDPSQYIFANEAPIGSNIYTFTFRVKYSGSAAPPLVIAAESMACKN